MSGVEDLGANSEERHWDTVAEPEEILPMVRALGQATAKIHCVSDAGSEQTLVDFQTEEAIVGAVEDKAEAFASELADFGAAYGQLAREDHRRFVDAFRNGAIPGLPAS